MAQSSAASAHFAECPTPLKAAWKTRQAAETALWWIMDRATELRTPSSVYLCRCRRWHLSSAADGSARGRRP
jgi:hypothetical protein